MARSGGREGAQRERAGGCRGVASRAGPPLMGVLLFFLGGGVVYILAALVRLQISLLRFYGRKMAVFRPMGTFFGNPKSYVGILFRVRLN